MAVNATAIWRVRPSGSNTNGGGYDPGISGAATDYSQQNAAQATGTLGTASGTATFTDAGAAFTSAMVGNALWIASGAGFTVGAYFIVTFNSSTSVVLDRSPGTGTVAHWAVGGGWADFWTNTTSSGPLVPGNLVNVLGSGVPNPSSYTYDYVVPAGFNLAVGNTTAGFIVIANDPATPSYKAPPDTTGGMPTVKVPAGDQVFGSSSHFFKVVGLWFVFQTGSQGVVFSPDDAGVNLGFGCVVDQFSFSSGLGWCVELSGSQTSIIGCEIFSSVAPGSPGTKYAFYATNNGGSKAIGCNIHDCVGGGIFIDGSVGGSHTGFSVINNIIAKCRGNGIAFTTAAANEALALIMNNTIDGNAGNGIEFVVQAALAFVTCINNIVSNHTGGGTFGITADVGTAAANSVVQQLVDYNSFYNNTANYNAISAGAHDTALGVTPYVASATENYTLA